MTPFDARLFLESLETERVGRGALRLHASIPSTNDAAFELAAAEPAASGVVVAEFQTMGRGRFGRRWESPAGSGLLASIVLPDVPPAPARLSALAAVAVAETLEGNGVAASIQWPNDLFAGERKIAGILLEAREERPARPVVVLGLGLNVAQRPDDFPPALRATSILAETGSLPPREKLLALFLRRLEAGLDALSRTGAGALEAAYRSRNRLLGRRITILDSGAPLSGIARDLSPEFGLALELPSGEVRRFAAEHVTIADVSG